MTAEYVGGYQPADALWDAIRETNLSQVDGEYLVGCAEARLGYPLTGQTRTDLLSLADGEVDYYRNHGPVYTIIDNDEFWLLGEKLTFEEAMTNAREDIQQHIADQAIEEASLKIRLEPKDMMASYRDQRIGSMVAEQCLGIKPIFGKGVNNGASN